MTGNLLPPIFFNIAHKKSCIIETFKALIKDYPSIQKNLECVATVYKIVYDNFDFILTNFNLTVRLAIYNKAVCLVAETKSCLDNGQIDRDNLTYKQAMFYLEHIIRLFKEAF